MRYVANDFVANKQEHRSKVFGLFQQTEKLYGHHVVKYLNVFTVHDHEYPEHCPFCPYSAQQAPNRQWNVNRGQPNTRVPLGTTPLQVYYTAKTLTTPYATAHNAGLLTGVKSAVPVIQYKVVQPLGTLKSIDKPQPWTSI